MKQTTRILLVDDHAIVCAGLRLLIENEPKLSVGGEAHNRVEALALAASEQPDIILLDLDLKGESSLDLLPELILAAREARVIILTGVRDSAMHRQAMRSGAMGVVLKEQAGEVLIKAIERVQEGEVWLDRATMASLLVEMTHTNNTGTDDSEAAKILTLTEREREVVQLIGQGLKNQQIADRLFISEATVRHHLTSIFDKLCLSDRLELAIYAYQYGLAKVPSIKDREQKTE